VVAPIVPHERHWGAGQALPMQRPFWQVSPPRQTLPQDPQLFESVAVSTHPPPQHICPAPHVLPQAPQLFGSVCVSTHPLPQHACPPPHVVGSHWFVVLLQVSQGPQVSPRLPPQ
jgi:hypothetical protein